MLSATTVTTRKRHREEHDEDNDGKDEEASSSPSRISKWCGTSTTSTTTTRTLFPCYGRNAVSPSPSSPASAVVPKQQLLLKKQVRFATALDGGIVEIHHPPPPQRHDDDDVARALDADHDDNKEVSKSKMILKKKKRKRRLALPLHNQAKRDLWWTKKEKTLLMEHSRRIAKRFKTSHPDDVEYYNRVYETCAQPPTQESSDFIEAATIMVPTLVRGLEWCVAPKTKTHRKAHVQDIVSSQHLLWGCATLGGGKIGEEEASREGRKGSSITRQQEILSSRSIRSSRPSRVFARLLGEGDAMSIAMDEEEEGRGISGGD